jgi:type II secretory pathway component PulF
VPLWLGFVWTAPNTLLGLLLGLLTFQVPRLAHGLVVFDRHPRGLTRLLAHEAHHVRQYQVWGPLFIPVYLLLGMVYGYRRHPMEIAAQRAASGPVVEGAS